MEKFIKCMINKTEFYTIENFHLYFKKIRTLYSHHSVEIILYEYENSYFVIKSFLLDYSVQERKLLSILKEVEHIKYISSKTNDVPKYYKDFCYHIYDKKYYGIMMEYISGITLDKVQNIDIRKLSSWLINIIFTLHSNNIIHKDIKEENIIYNIENDRYVLIDFGFSVNLTKIINKQNIFSGTPYYLSPNIYNYYNGYIQIDIKTLLKQNDVWAIGITLFNLIERKFPFEETTNLQILINNLSTIRKLNCDDENINSLVNFILDEKNTPSIEDLIKFI